MKKTQTNSIPGLPGDRYNTPMLRLIEIGDVIRTSPTSSGSGDNKDIEVDGNPDTPII